MTAALLMPSADARRHTPRVGIAAFGWVRATREEMPTLRKQPGPCEGPALPSGLLRHADEQTVAGLAAVLRALHDCSWQARSFRDWGVLAAPRFLGRSAIAAALSQFAQTGARGVSPLVIPHYSLHAVSATISLALGMHGPNFGIGGGPGHLVEGLLTALSVLQEAEELPGVWLVLTAWEPELCVDGHGQGTNAAMCHAVALALVPGTSEWHLGWTATVASGAEAPCLSQLAAFLADPRDQAWSCPLGWPASGALTIARTAGCPARGATHRGSPRSMSDL